MAQIIIACAKHDPKLQATTMTDDDFDKIVSIAKKGGSAPVRFINGDVAPFYVPRGWSIVCVGECDLDTAMAFNDAQLKAEEALDNGAIEAISNVNLAKFDRYYIGGQAIMNDGFNTKLAGEGDEWKKGDPHPPYAYGFEPEKKRKRWSWRTR